MADISLKENASRLIVGKEKDGGDAKRQRLNISATQPHRIPFGQKGVAAAPLANIVPVRAPLPRAPQHHIPVFTSRQIPRVAPAPVVIIEDDEEEIWDEDMDIEEENLRRQVELNEARYAQDEEGEELPDNSSIHDEEEHELEVEEMVGIEEEEHAEDEDQDLEHTLPNVWPQITPDRAMIYEKKVQAIRDVFEDSPDDCDSAMVSEYAEDIFKYMAELEVSIRYICFSTDY